VILLNAIELEVAAESATDAVPKTELALGRVDGDGKSLGELINQPSLNIRGLSSGRIGEQAANIIPATATAALDLRLVDMIVDILGTNTITASVVDYEIASTAAMNISSARLKALRQ
jgi:acetylornithine deacetylase/succinyl-diaminopimelate desuccinylase-like protein